MAAIDLDGTDYEIVCQIYDYICENVAYNTDTPVDTRAYPNPYSYTAFVDHKAHPLGYALIFYRMALTAGIDAKVVQGTVDGTKTYWNVVELDNVFFNIDTCRGAQN